MATRTRERPRARQGAPAGGHEQSAAAGKAARARVPLEAHGEFQPAPDRDPVGLLIEQGRSRIPELVPVRHGRMLVSPFTFFRGAALPMAADLAAAPGTGLRAQLCGDAHLSNFGAFGYSAPIEQFDPVVMAGYAELCGWTLARAHARTGDRVAIAAYLGGSARFEEAVTDFAVSYADQTIRDHAALAAAVADGQVQARMGV